MVRAVAAAAAARRPRPCGYARARAPTTRRTTSCTCRKDKHTTFEEIYPPGLATFDSTSGAAEILAAAQKGLPSDITVNVTGHDPLEEASTHGGGTGNVLVEAVIGGIGAIFILLFVFGTLPAMLMPVAVAVAAIFNTFTLVWALTYVTDVSIIVQFLIALVGLGVAIDYALLMIFRFRDELREGEDTETALVETMTHAGRSVIVSGSTVAVGLLSMIILPLPFIRSIGIAGMLIPAVSVLAAITLMPALLAVLGDRINSARVLPKRFADDGHPEDGAWGRWARLVLRRPWVVAAAGMAIVGVLVFYGLQLNPNESQLKNFPGTGTAIAGPRRACPRRHLTGRDETVRDARRARREPRGRRRGERGAPQSSARPYLRGRDGPRTRHARRGVPRRSTVPRPASRT